MSISNKIGIVIPSLNPDENLLQVVEQIQSRCSLPVIIVNDGSAPGHEHIFNELEKQANVIVLQHSANRGKGRALKTAFDAFLQRFPEGIGVVTADADGQHKAEDILRCAQALAEHPEQLIWGYRDFSKSEMPWKSYWGNTLTGAIFSLFFRRKLMDTQTGLRGIPRNFMKNLLTLRGERFEFETEMLCEAVALKIEFFPIPIETVYINSNRATHFNPKLDSIRIYRVLFRRMFLQFFCFSFSGLISAFVDVTLFVFFFHILLGSMQNQKRLRLALALIFARAISLTVNYSINRNWVFGSRRSKLQSFVQYLLLCGLVLGCAYLLTRLGQLLMPSVEITWIKIVVDLLLFSMNFLIQKHFIFY